MLETIHPQPSSSNNNIYNIPWLTEMDTKKQRISFLVCHQKMLCCKKQQRELIIKIIGYKNMQGR
uniref:Uncharacterized protein n=1 Tax=Arion vulgaris TaxID=1028688 RepID=A0A0B7AMN9_9EUPU